MKIKFKNQQFQADAAKAVCDVFTGQPYLTPTYMMDQGFIKEHQVRVSDKDDFMGWGNQLLLPELNDDRILGNLNKIQRKGLLNPSPKVDGHYKFTVEM